MSWELGERGSRCSLSNRSICLADFHQDRPSHLDGIKEILHLHQDSPSLLDGIEEILHLHQDRPSCLDGIEEMLHLVGNKIKPIQKLLMNTFIRLCLFVSHPQLGTSLLEQIGLVTSLGQGWNHC